MVISQQVKARCFGIIGTFSIIVLAVQCAYIVWQVLLFNWQQPTIMQPTAATSYTPPDNYSWMQQNISPKKVVATPKKTYRFVGLRVTVDGIIHNNNRTSVAIISSQLAKNMIVSVGDLLKGTDIEVEEIAVNHVMFREADKQFRVQWKESILPSMQKDIDIRQAQTNVQQPHTVVQTKEQKPNNSSNGQNNTIAITTFSPQTQEEQQIAQQLMEQPQRLLDYLLFSPVMKNGAVIGGRVTVLKKHALFARMGIQTGDIVQAVNGTPVAELGIDMLEKGLAQGRVLLTTSRNNEIRTIEITL